jgi:hypothetical protein
MTPSYIPLFWCQTLRMSDSQLANHQDGTAMRMLVVFHLAQPCTPANGRTIRWQQKDILVMVNASIRTQLHTAAPGLAFQLLFT